MNNIVPNSTFWFLNQSKDLAIFFGMEYWMGADESPLHSFHRHVYKLEITGITVDLQGQLGKDGRMT